MSEVADAQQLEERDFDLVSDDPLRLTPAALTPPQPDAEAP